MSLLSINEWYTVLVSSLGDKSLLKHDYCQTKAFFTTFLNEYLSHVTYWNKEDLFVMISDPLVFWYYYIVKKNNDLTKGAGKYLNIIVVKYDWQLSIYLFFY